MVHALHGIDLDFGFFVAGEVDIGKDQQRVRAVDDVEAAVETHLLDAALFASGLVEGVGETDGFVVNLVGQVRWQQRDR